jgi:hypothetical protein
MRKSATSKLKKALFIDLDKKDIPIIKIVELLSKQEKPNIDPRKIDISKAVKN